MRTFLNHIKNETLCEIKTSLENLWQRMIQLSEFFPYSFAGRGPTRLRARVRNRDQLENRSDVVPKTEFQDGGDRSRIFTHKIIILA